jgi:hypothetical protein
VVTASSALVAISKLQPGDKVLATSTRTGKTQAEPVAAVLVHYDKDLYDLKVRATGGTSVIKTTRSHLFWNQTTGRWTKAGALKYGTHLRTPSNGSAAVLGGWTPKVTTGWMWDLTIPGNNDHDFYIQTTKSISVLVHNCSTDPQSEHMDPVENRHIFSAAETYPKTAGDLYVPGGSAPEQILSGIKGWANQFRGQGISGFARDQLTHVEGHAAAYMRINKVMSADLEINKVPCDVGPGGGCDGLLSRMLPEGAVLRVYGPDGFFKAYTGEPDP